MGEKTGKKQKKGTISEEDVATILQRYTATTILALLHEVAQVQDVKLDWNALVKKTRTGITNPREYQTLWRHLAYRHVLLEKIEDGVKPLDDESDLEYDLEALPALSNEASIEASAYVKVLIASGLPNDSGLEKGLTVEAPLFINIPSNKSADIHMESSQYATMRGTNIAVPVSVQKQPLPAVTSAEGLDTNGTGGGNLPARRKRKPWSEAEDMELFAAVQKCGEGNWANILKGDFKGDRTASQLSQRWNIIKKRNRHSNIRSSGQLSEVNHQATRQALKMALDKPGVDNLKTASSAGWASTSVHADGADPPSAGTLPQKKSQPNSASTGTKKLGTSSTLARRTRPLSKAPLLNPVTTGSDAVKAAAVAAGARIATPSDHAVLFKAAQLKNAIHFKSSADHLSSPLVRNLHSSIPPNASRPHLGPAHGNANAGTVVQSNQSSSAPEKSVSPETNNGLEVKASVDNVDCSSGSPKENQVAISANVQRVEAAVDVTSSSVNSLKEPVQEVGHVAISGNAQTGEIQGNQVPELDHAAKDQDQDKGEQPTTSSNPQKGSVAEVEDALNEQVRDSKVASPSPENDLNQKVGSGVINPSSTDGDKKAAFPVKDGDQPIVMKICEDEKAKQNREEPQSMDIDATDEKMDSISNSASGMEPAVEEEKVVKSE